MNARTLCPGWLRLAALLSISVLLQACAGPDGDGMGGTGISYEGDGIGGTGISAALDPDGIGGTGIVGEITDIGSIHVAGLKVSVPDRALVRRGTRMMRSDVLARGQVVAVLADIDGDQLVAKEIRIMDALVGEVTFADGASIEVLGQRLRIDGSALNLGLNLSSVSALKVGQRVRVSGLWRGAGSLLVTRIEAARPDEADALFAPVSAVSANGLTVGGLEIRGVQLPGVTAGDYVTASGRARGTILQANTVQASAPIPFREPLARLFVDGFPASGRGRQISIGALSATLPDASALRASINNVALQGGRTVVGAVVRSGVAEIRMLRPAAPARPLRDALPVPMVSPEKPIVPELPTLPERPVLPVRPPKPERPQPVERPQRSIDARPTDVRPLSRPTGAVR